MDNEQYADAIERPLTADEFAADLCDVLYDANVAFGGDREIARLCTFAEDGIRFNGGVTVRLSDGTEYQVTVVRSN